MNFEKLLFFCGLIMNNLFSSVSRSDIKPENLLISSDDILKLCDFGKFSCHSVTLLSKKLWFEFRRGGLIIFTLKLSVMFRSSACDSSLGSLISQVRLTVKTNTISLSPCKHLSLGNYFATEKQPGAVIDPLSALLINLQSSLRKPFKCSNDTFPMRHDAS